MTIQIAGTGIERAASGRSFLLLLNGEMIMEYLTRKLTEIYPYENNPRIITDAIVDVMESIRQCGYVAPIVIDEDGVILAGHTRYEIDNDDAGEEQAAVRETMKVAVLYAVGYMFEHREEADHHALVLTLRSILFAVREGAV